MSKLRFRVVETAFKKKPVAVAVPAERPSEYFAKYVFNKEKMFRYLLLDPKILKLLILGMLALLLSGIGGILGGYIMYYIKKGNYNPVIGIAAVSCVPTTAKVAQKIVSKDNPDSFILGDALGANISGVITSAIITGIYITIIPLL